MIGVKDENLVHRVDDHRIGMIFLGRHAEGHAAILVSVASVACKGPRFIADGQRAARDQGYAIRFTPELEIESVRSRRGERPWVK